MIKNRLWIVSSIFIIVLFISTGFACADQKTEELISKIQAQAKTINSYSSDLTMNMQIMGQRIIYTGKLSFKKPNKSRMEMSGKIGHVDIKQIIISNGKTAWTYHPNMKMARKIDLGKLVAETGDETKQRNGDPSNPFQSLKRNSITYIRTEKIDDKNVYLFQGTPEISGIEDLALVPEKVEIGIYADNGMISKMVMLDKEDKEMMSQYYSNIQLNVKIPDSEFEFTPPEGIQVMDMTDPTIKSMKETGEETPEK
ncbi:outer membrane lipoprotein carrier protein LolA [bacterium]|nr:outer membrane lipoprotein carrier protein LolA [bacterium]